ncbi:MAG: Gfo/Idh/MocA family protein [Thermoguttaceae bacterium]
MQKIKLGIVGAGRLGSFHADKAAQHPQIILQGVCDPVESGRRKLAEKHQIADYKTVGELLPHVDAVVIASPTIYHHELGCTALEQGVHVLMEKPLAVSQQEARELVQLSQKHHRVLQVGHVEQFNPAWSAATPALEMVRAGKRAVISAERTSGYTFRSTDVGVVHDLMVHDLDLILSIVPAEVLSVEANGFNIIGKTNQGGHEDMAWCRIVFENGTVALLRASRAEQQAIRTMKIQMSHFATEIDFATRTTRMIRASEQVQSGQFSPAQLGTQVPTEIVPQFMQNEFTTFQVVQDSVDALSLEMDDFVDSILKNRRPQVSGERALQSIILADQIAHAILITEERSERVREAA